jgi:hypothetical protein
MSLTITLITPPDIFENHSPGIFLINLSENEQDEATKWLAECKRDLDLNIYFIQKEPNVVWFFHALACSSHKYVNLDDAGSMIDLLAGYVLGKPNTYYKTNDKNKQAVYNHINQNRVNHIRDFLERAIGEKE